ncbi:MAG: Flp pilus assembly complex ATPase component TadA [Bacilli bacterium]|nr:Flp pilus assembly complex ATPase component TadA [Bacilli bacterium]
MNENIFDKLDFGPFRELLDNDDITDISYDNNGQIWIRSLTQGSMRVEIEGATPEFVEKLAFQCSNVMGTTFNNAKPFLDAESAELRMNFVHQSIATNGIALVIRKTPAKIRLSKEKLIKEDYFTPAIHDLLIKCVEGHCNIMVAGETGSGKTEFVKYLASHTIQNEKIITIEDTLELHLDKIYPQRDIVAMKTNNVASYTDVLVTCMRQNPKWILLSEVRSAEAVSAVRNSISSGHNILSTIHADKASAIPYRMYSLMETDLDVHQFLTTIYRYIQIGVHIKAFYSKEYGQFHREVDEVCEFFVDDKNEPQSRIIYQKQMGKIMMCKPSYNLIEYLENQNISIQEIIKDLPDELPITEQEEFNSETEKPVENTEQKNNNPQEVVEENNNEAGTETVTPDPNLPGAKPDEEVTKEPGAEVGIAESIPVVSEDGNVQLNNPVVTPGGLTTLEQQMTPPPQNTEQPFQIPTAVEQPPVAQTAPPVTVEQPTVPIAPQEVAAQPPVNPPVQPATVEQPPVQPATVEQPPVVPGIVAPPVVEEAPPPAPPGVPVANNQLPQATTNQQLIQPVAQQAMPNVIPNVVRLDA